MESPRPFLFVDMNRKHCITDYEMNLKNRYSQVPGLSFVAYIRIRFDNEVSQALMWISFGVSHAAVRYGVPSKVPQSALLGNHRNLGSLERSLTLARGI